MRRSDEVPNEEHRGRDSRFALIAELPRRILLTGRRSIIVRSAQPDDEQRLAAFYDDLGPDDRHLRFLSRRRPPRDVIRALVNPQRDEVRLVAELHDDGASRVVAEAGYSMTSNGNGEFAIAVAPQWRNWLGPYLLDITVDLAGNNRVPNLEAEVHDANAFLQALMQARGCVLLSDDPRGARRLMIGTGEDGPTWSRDDTRPRVLVESPSGRSHVTEEMRRAGMSTIVCPGPRTDRPCPALTGSRCALAEGADVVVVPHMPTSPEWEAIVRGHCALHPDVPVVVGSANRRIADVTLDDILIPAHMHLRFRAAMRMFAPHGQ